MTKAFAAAVFPIEPVLFGNTSPDIALILGIWGDSVVDEELWTELTRSEDVAELVVVF